MNEAPGPAQMDRPERRAPLVLATGLGDPSKRLELLTFSSVFLALP
jgi:hypothetical protein